MQNEKEVREGANNLIEEIRSLNAQLSGVLVSGDIDKIAEFAALLGIAGICLTTISEILK